MNKSRHEARYILKSILGTIHGIQHEVNDWRVTSFMAVPPLSMMQRLDDGPEDGQLRVLVLGPVEEGVEVLHSARELSLQFLQGKSSNPILFPWKKMKSYFWKRCFKTKEKTLIRSVESFLNFNTLMMKKQWYS